MNLLVPKGASKTETIMTYLYLLIMFVGGYGIIINFLPSEKAYVISKPLSIVVALLLSIPFLFFNGWKKNTSDTKKLFSIITLSLITWFFSWCIFTFTIPSQIIKFTGKDASEIVKIYEKDTSRHGYRIRVKPLNNNIEKYSLKVTSTFYNSVKRGNNVIVSGKRSNLGFLVNDIRKH